MGTRKFIEEFGPLLAFFLLNSFGPRLLGRPQEEALYIATGGFMLALLVAIGSGLLRGERPKNMTLVSAGFVFVFGGLTLILQNETFIKIKPTLIYILFALVLGIGLARGRSYLRVLMGDMLPLDPAGWNKLTARWAVFFLALAALNELVWRTQSTDIWVSFKVFAIVPLTIGFMMLQMPLINKHSLETPEDGSDQANR